MWSDLKICRCGESSLGQSSLWNDPVREFDDFCYGDDPPPVFAPFYLVIFTLVRHRCCFSIDKSYRDVDGKGFMARKRLRYSSSFSELSTTGVGFPRNLADSIRPITVDYWRSNQLSNCTIYLINSPVKLCTHTITIHTRTLSEFDNYIVVQFCIGLSVSTKETLIFPWFIIFGQSHRHDHVNAYKQYHHRHHDHRRVQYVHFEDCSLTRLGKKIEAFSKALLWIWLYRRSQWFQFRSLPIPR